VPDFLPLATRRALHAEEIREHREAKEAEAERERLAEAHRSSNLAMFKDMAEARGQHISAMELASGQVAGRTLGDIFAEASAMADMADAREAARERRDSGQRLNLCIRSGRFQDDGKRESSQNRRPTPTEQKTRPCRGAGHERLAITIQNKHA